LGDRIDVQRIGLYRTVVPEQLSVIVAELHRIGCLKRTPSTEPQQCA
jgi:hypothetical protein